jgi:D-alanine-D-alanine ligase
VPKPVPKPALPRILILSGGPDAERPVSLKSGNGVAEALRACGTYEVVALVIDRITAPELLAHRPAVVFPVLHGRWGEGGPLQEVLEEARVPYVGCRPKAARLAMDKLATKLLASGEGVPTPRAQELRAEDPCEVPLPLVLKPVDDGSSVDLRICRSGAEVAAARGALHPRRARLMAEQYIEGREMTAGILLGEVLPLIEIRAAGGVYDYDAKYTRDDTDYLLDPPLSAGVAQRIAEAAARIFDRLGCRDLARVDFMVDDRGPWLLEVNTMPGFTSHSLLPKAAAHRGIAMPELCARLVERARTRGVDRLTQIS